MNPEKKSLSTSDLAEAGPGRPSLLKKNPAAESIRPGNDLQKGEPASSAPIQLGPGSEQPGEPAPPSSDVSLVEPQAAQGFRSRWKDIQISFVDEPRSAVQKADQLVAETMKQLAEDFASEKNKLESQWDRGGEVSTEDLRQALQRYRSYFERLLAA